MSDQLPERPEDVLSTEAAEPDAGPVSPERPRVELGEPVVVAAGPRAEPGGDVPGGADPDLDLAHARAEWRDIQLLFVDDPRGALERALHAVDTELAGLLETVRQQQSEPPLDSADSTTAVAAGPGDTERLRLALRSCRAFWEDLASLGGQFTGGR